VVCGPSSFPRGGFKKKNNAATTGGGSRWLCARPLGGLGEASVRTLDSDSAYLLRLWTLGTLSMDSAHQEAGRNFCLRSTLDPRPVEGHAGFVVAMMQLASRALCTAPRVRLGEFPRPGEIFESPVHAECRR
jgi:hypothetical protein